MLAQLSFRVGGVSRVSYCSSCGRPLSNPRSVDLGIGPVCRGHASSKEFSMSDLCKRDKFSDTLVMGISLTEKLVLHRENFAGGKVGEVYTNVPHLVIHHSPNGYEFGYGGSGPADLALNVCQFYLNHTGYSGEKTQCQDGICWSLAWVLYQDFKRDFIAGCPRGGRNIPWARIQDWFNEHITDDMRAMYAPMEAEDDQA